jgi:hypothetical protein
VRDPFRFAGGAPISLAKVAIISPSKTEDVEGRKVAPLHKSPQDLGWFQIQYSLDGFVQGLQALLEIYGLCWVKEQRAILSNGIGKLTPTRIGRSMGRNAIFQVGDEPLVDGILLNQRL